MKLFEKIYNNATLQRFYEAREIGTPQQLFDAVKDGYLARLLNGKKFVPSWLETMIEDDSLTKVTYLLNDLIPQIKEVKGNVTKTLCFLIKKAPTFSIFETIIKDSKDTLIQYSRAIESKWILSIPSYKEASDGKYNYETWHKLEKDIQDTLAKKHGMKKRKNLSDEEKAVLYDILYTSPNWELCVPKSFEGDSFLSTGLKPFVNNGETYTKTRWCTAADERYFKSYTSDENVLYVIRHFENGEYIDAWQIAFNKKETHSFMDKTDSPSYLYVLDNAPDELLEKITFDAQDSELSLLDFKEYCYLPGYSKKLNKFFINAASKISREDYLNNIEVIQDLIGEATDNLFTMAAREDVDVIMDYIRKLQEISPILAKNMPFKDIFNILTAHEGFSILEEYTEEIIRLLEARAKNEIPPVLALENPDLVYFCPSQIMSLEDLLKLMKQSSDDLLEEYIRLIESGKLLSQLYTERKHYWNPSGITEPLDTYIYCKYKYPNLTQFYTDNEKELFICRTGVTMTLKNFCDLIAKDRDERAIQFMEYVKNGVTGAPIAYWLELFGNNGRIPRYFREFLDKYKAGLTPRWDEKLLRYLGFYSKEGTDFPTRQGLYWDDVARETPEDVGIFLHNCQKDDLFTKVNDPSLGFILDSGVPLDKIEAFLKGRKNGEIPTDLSCEEALLPENYWKQK